jgi:large subunit ribosomal protein L17
MRHRKSNKRLGRQSAHRKAVLRNQVKSLIEKESIKTTLALAKQSRRLAEKLITLGKDDTLAARRQAFEVLSDRSLVKMLFSDIAPRFATRSGGYTRIVQLGPRKGDNAPLAILELTEIKAKEEKKAAKPKKTKKVKKEAPEKSETKKPEDKTEDKKQDNKEDKKGFIGGLRKFLKQDKGE